MGAIASTLPHFQSDPKSWSRRAGCPISSLTRRTLSRMCHSLPITTISLRWKRSGVQLERTAMCCGLLLSAAAVAKGRVGFRCLDLSVCAQLKKNAFMLVVHPSKSECFALPSNPLTKRAVEACSSASTLQVDIR